MNKTNIKGIISKTVKKHNKWVDDFLNQDFHNNDQNLIFVLKAHLFMEFLIDEIFNIALPNPKMITRMSFSQKLKIYEAIGFDNDDEEFLAAVNLVNDIRNKYGHNIKFKLSSHEATILINKVKLDGKKLGGRSNRERFDGLVLYVLAYLRVMVSLHKLFPLMSAYFKNVDSFEKDKWFKSKGVDKILKKEIRLFMEDEDLVDLITSAD